MDMIVHWQRVGFVHGVMNTDNMSILGLTIDYGPYGWLEGYDVNWTPNTTDRENRRYRFGYQPRIALWNLVQLANTLVALIEETEPLQEILDGYLPKYEKAYLAMMYEKLGLVKTSLAGTDLISQLEAILQLSETDMTIFFRNLANFQKGTPIDEKGEFLQVVQDAFYQPEEIKDNVLARWKNWFRGYQEVLQNETRSDDQRKASMNQVNPKYVLRNYMAQRAIDAANLRDYSLIEELYQLLKQPYAEQPEHQKWFAKRPEWARHKVGCSMLSCSS
jgi:uncharacterized protein YdiU (UPF0061 family)